MKKGLVQVYTGEGKGKTTAAIGQALRARGRDYKVLLVQFLKGKKGSGEISTLEQLGIKVICKGRHLGLSLNRIVENERRRVREEWDNFLDKISQEVLAGDYDLLILDEINVACHYRLIDENKLLRFIKEKPDGLEIILTGRYASPRLIKTAHLVSEVKKIKHPYNEGIKARSGIEF
ncbi:MAG: cob(I)yrinic acid a,c-diamide adenosyltransferase [bacterium]